MIILNAKADKWRVWSYFAAAQAALRNCLAPRCNSEPVRQRLFRRLDFARITARQSQHVTSAICNCTRAYRGKISPVWVTPAIQFFWRVSGGTSHTTSHANLAPGKWPSRFEKEKTQKLILAAKKLESHERVSAPRIGILPFFFSNCNGQVHGARFDWDLVWKISLDKPLKKSNRSSHSHGCDFNAILAYNCKL